VASSHRPIPTRRTSTSSASGPTTAAAASGRDLYERFFGTVRAAGRDVVRCVTGPVNEGSIAFHRRLGFEIEAEVADYDGAGEARVLLRKRLS